MFLKITTLINHKDKPKKSERTLAAIHRVGQAVSVAVGRFVAVGEAIAAENQELKDEMGQACFEARRAGMLLLDIYTHQLQHDSGVLVEQIQNTPHMGGRRAKDTSLCD